MLWPSFLSKGRSKKQVLGLSLVKKARIGQTLERPRRPKEEAAPTDFINWTMTLDGELN